jgi:hypothetical protein
VTNNFNAVVSFLGRRNDGKGVHILLDSLTNVTFYIQGVSGGACRIRDYINPLFQIKKYY